MFGNSKIIAIVTARKGSKRLPRKNYRCLCGKPLIAWTIKEALRSRYIDKIIVSTDDRVLAGISVKFGAEAPFLRPAALATDRAKTTDVITHALKWLEDAGGSYDVVVLLQPTSPLRVSGDIDSAIEMLFKRNAGAVVSVCEAEHHPFWCNRLPGNGRMGRFLRKNVLDKRCQDLPVLYKINGAIYAARRRYFKRIKGFLGGRTYAYIMPRERSIDIDTKFDMELAEAVLRRRPVKDRKKICRQT